jgi:hypothetical protein
MRLIWRHLKDLQAGIGWSQLGQHQGTPGLRRPASSTATEHAAFPSFSTRSWLFFLV